MNAPELRLDRILLWAEALESGQYEQGRGALTSGNADCCLGVACKVAIAHGLQVDVMVHGNGVVAYNGEHTLPPMAIVNWYGFDNDNPELALDDEAHDATAWNDHIGATFGKIARAIRQTYSLDSGAKNEGTMERDPDAQG